MKEPSYAMQIADIRRQDGYEIGDNLKYYIGTICDITVIDDAEPDLRFEPVDFVTEHNYRAFYLYDIDSSVDDDTLNLIINSDGYEYELILLEDYDSGWKAPGYGGYSQTASELLP